jgi:hypothetical protein
MTLEKELDKKQRLYLLDVDEVLSQVEQTTPVGEFVFGHTQTQIEYFQTSSQHGNEKWEYWQHILQLRTLHSTVREQRVSFDELIFEIEDASSWWPFWNQAKRKRGLPRLLLKKDSIQKTINEKLNEIKCHLEVIDRKYSHLKDLKEKDILSDESGYWTKRLGRQLGASRISRLLGISEGEVLAVLALPTEQRQQVFREMGDLLSTSIPMLANKENDFG